VDLSQTDLFNALSSLREQGMTLRQIAEVMGKTEGYIKNLFVGINEISRNEELQELIGSHAGVTIQDVVETNAIPNKQDRLNLLEEKKKGTIKRSDLRKKVKELKSPKSEKPLNPIVERTKIRMKAFENLREIVLFTDKAVSVKAFRSIAEDVRRFFVLHDGYDLEITALDTEPKTAKARRS
jgi:Ca2+-binding EF-hand superfamily protein